MEDKASFTLHIDGLVQETRNSIALAMELCLSCINPSILYAIVDDDLATHVSMASATKVLI